MSPRLPLQVDELLIGTAVESNQPSGSTTDGTKSWIWSDDLVLEYVTPAPALETLSFGYLLRLDPEHSVEGSPLVGVDKWYEKARKSTFVRANDFYLPWTVANTAAYLFKDVLAKAEEDHMKVKAISTITHDGKTCQAGEEVEVSKDQKEALIKAGAVRGPDAPKAEDVAHEDQRLSKSSLRPTIRLRRSCETPRRRPRS